MDKTQELLDWLKKVEEQAVKVEGAFVALTNEFREGTLKNGQARRALEARLENRIAGVREDASAARGEMYLQLLEAIGEVRESRR